jgi:hypothetical protein
MRRVALSIVSLVALSCCAPVAGAQTAPPEALANKTIIYTIKNVIGSGYVFVAASGNIYSTFDHAFRAGDGVEYRLGSSHEHAMNPNCRMRTEASASGSSLTLRYTRTCPGTAPLSGWDTYDVQGKTCRPSSSEPHKGFPSCRVVAGNQMPKK